MQTPPASRRAVLGAGASLLAASQAQARGAAPDPSVMRILERYDGFGDKASGGPGDNASGEWLEGELEALGYACARQTFEAPAFEGEARLTCGTVTADLIPQAIVRSTP
jgi:hypothetical protein